jgi:hypothetical protein
MVKRIVKMTKNTKNYNNSKKLITGKGLMAKLVKSEHYIMVFKMWETQNLYENRR